MSAEIEDLKSEIKVLKTMLRFEVARGNELEDILAETLADIRKITRKPANKLPIQKKMMILAQ